MTTGARETIDTDVLVVGAGPTGLLLANLLGGMGRRVVIVDRNPSTVEQPRAVSIDDESMRALQAVGLAESVEAAAACGYGSIYRGPSGRAFARVMPRTREFGWEKRNAFEQPVLENILREGLARHSGVATRFSTEVTEIAGSDAGVVASTRPPEGSDRPRQVFSARYLVGCDGARSTIRKAIGATLEGESFEEPWLILDLERTLNRCRHTEVSCNPARPFITLPGPGGIRRYEFKLMPGETAENVTREEHVRRLLSQAGPDADMPLRRIQVYSFHARTATLWRKGRVLLAGDAAHLTPPFAGQGMNSGLRDAHNLAWKLDEALRAEDSGADADELLRSYETERRPHAWEMIQLALTMGRVMMPRSALQARLTRFFFRTIGLLPVARDYVAQMRFKPRPRFRAGYIWQEGAGAAVDMVGQMFPQPLVEDVARRRHRLDDILPDAPVVVVFDEAPEQVLAPDTLEALRRAGAWVVGIVPEGINPMLGPFPVLRDAGRELSAGSHGKRLGSACLLRRDRYVAAIRPVAEAQRLVAIIARLSPGRNSPVTHRDEEEGAARQEAGDASREPILLQEAR